MGDKKKLDLTNVEIGYKEFFTAHPVRAIMAAPFILWSFKVFISLFFVPFTMENVIIVIIKLTMLGVVSWLVYGPINYHNLKKAKQMEKMAEYMVNNTQQAPVIANEEVVEYKYCAFCGKQLNANWKACPYCGKQEE